MKKTTLFLVMFTLITTLSACNNAQETKVKKTEENKQIEETENAAQKAANDLEKEMKAMTGAMEQEIVENKVEKITTTYKNPKQEVNVEIDYSLDTDGKVKTMKVSSNNYDLSKFNSEIQNDVIGKGLDEINVYVAGESLVSDAFNAAIK